MTDRNDLSEKKQKVHHADLSISSQPLPRKLPAWHRTPPQQGSPGPTIPLGHVPSWSPSDDRWKNDVFLNTKIFFSEKAIWDLIKPWGHWWSLKRSWENHGFPPWDQGTERYLSASRAAMAPEPAEVMAWWWNEPPTERDDRGDTMTWLKYPLVNGILWWFNGILWDFMGSNGILPSGYSHYPLVN